jgi:hypothetical protein
VACSAGLEHSELSVLDEKLDEEYLFFLFYWVFVEERWARQEIMVRPNFKLSLSRICQAITCSGSRLQKEETINNCYEERTEPLELFSINSARINVFFER